MNSVVLIAYTEIQQKKKEKQNKQTTKKSPWPLPFPSPPPEKNIKKYYSKKSPPPKHLSTRLPPQNKNKQANQPTNL